MSVFPLPLTPFEAYMVHDDWPEYPMTAVLQFHLRGNVDRGIFEQALGVASRRHPLFIARLERGKRGKYVWTEPTAPPAIDWGPLGQVLTCRGGPGLDLFRGQGYRFWVRHDTERAVMTCQMHHAVTDGIGGLRFMADILVAYDQLMRGDASDTRLGALDESGLARRGELDSKPPESLGTLTKIALLFRESAKFLFLWPRPAMGDLSQQPRSKPTNLDRSGQVDGPELPIPPLHHRRLSIEDSLAMRDIPRLKGVNVNDFLLATLFGALEEWNREACGANKQAGGVLRLTMPMNMRTKQHDLIPAANAISYAFLTRTAKSIRDGEALLKGIEAETKMIKQWKAGGVFLESIKGLDRVGMLRPIVRSKICFSTAVLSNLGDPVRRLTAVLPRINGEIRAGNLVLEEVTGAPPIRHKTRFSILAVWLDNRLSLGMHADPREFSPEAAQRFLDLYCRHLITASPPKVPSSPEKPALEQLPA